MAKLSQFRRRTDKIWNGTRRAVPHENLKSFLAQVRAHCAADNSEADYSNNFSICAEHTKSNALGMVDTFVNVKLPSTTPGGNAEVCEFQGAQKEQRSLPVRRSSSEGGSPPPTF